MTPQGLANFVWALATMQERAPKGLLVDIEAAAVAQMQQSSPQSLANTLWALSSLDHEPVVGDGCSGWCVVCGGWWMVCSGWYVVVHGVLCIVQVSCIHISM